MCTEKIQSSGVSEEADVGLNAESSENSLQLTRKRKKKMEYKRVRTLIPTREYQTRLLLYIGKGLP